MFDTGSQSAGKIFWLGWLVGFIDGEGSVSIRRLGKRNGKTRNDGRFNQLAPSIQITSTDLSAIEKAHEILKLWGVGSLIYHRNRVDKTPTHILWCSGYKRLHGVLSLITPFLVIKKRQAQLVYELVDRRKDLNRNTPYSERDIEISDQVKELNIKPLERSRRTLNDCTLALPLQDDTV
jgi:hypothetical protein